MMCSLVSVEVRPRFSWLNFALLYRFMGEVGETMRNLDGIIAAGIHGSRHQSHHIYSLKETIFSDSASNFARAMNNFVTAMRN
ncbi:hypothetical protein Y032_0002g603 [Ancylostoma ceylanicum]|uniref:Uncharacterized protein n=1 Tax=Ancylostoma ceylanicum TaxID=53326 RepID=A0A016W2B0_9BILA|nr:hypothetical protein Y032_0002g603 [Ancylostoma ceylanicum]